MAKEHVVSMKDDVLGEVQLDVGNGIVYDLKGNQIDKWAVTDNAHSQQLADYAADELLGVFSAGVGSGVHFGPDAAERTRESKERARSVRMGGWDRTGGDDLVKMDLGYSDVHQAAALPNYAAGYRNHKPIADVYAPPMIVSKPSDKYYTFAKEDAFQRVVPTIGTPNGAVPEIAPRLANSTFTTLERALAGFVSTQLEAAADAALRIRQATMQRVLQGLLIERELRIATLATTTSNWDSSVVTALGATAKWNGGTTSDPVKDIQTAMLAAWGDVAGIIMNEQVFQAWQRNGQTQKFFAYKNDAAPLPSASQMSALLQLPPIYVAKMRYMTSATAKDFIWGNSVVLFCQPAQLPPTSQEDVSSGTTFRWNGATVSDGQVSQGMIVREFFVQDRGSMGGNKVVLIHHDADVQTSAFAGALITGAYA